jgi:hypothetical protein
MMVLPNATVRLVILWADACYPGGFPDDVPDAELVARFYRWVRRRQHQDPRVRRLLRQAGREWASPWN